jgi:hypothetical protein
MIRKISQIGNALSAKEQKQISGGGYCFAGSYCTFQFATAAACQNWAINEEGAQRYTFNTSNCQCCARYYEPCGPGGIWL